MSTATKTNPEAKLKAEYQALKQEHSELGRLYELRGRDLASARKAAAKADDLKDELDRANEKVAILEKALTASQNEAEQLCERLARNESVLEDVAVLKRLVG